MLKLLKVLTCKLLARDVFTGRKKSASSMQKSCIGENHNSLQIKIQRLENYEKSRRKLRKQEI